MVDSIVGSSYVAVAIIGLIHGLEPGHGWPIAALLSFRRTRPMFYGFVASNILSSAHFLSSLAVVLFYYIAEAFMDFTSPYLRYLVAAILIIIAIRFFTERIEGNRMAVAAGGLKTSLRSLAAFALILGFAHEEEFMILALAVGGVNPLLLMISYASAVTASLVGVTLISIRAYTIVVLRIKRYERYIPKISSIVLIILALLFLFGIY